MELVERLRLIAAWHTPGGKTPDHKCPSKHKTCTEAANEIERLRAALEWYAVRVADCRKASSEGVEACRQLDADGGSRARQALGTDKEDRTDG